MNISVPPPQKKNQQPTITKLGLLCYGGGGDKQNYCTIDLCQRPVEILSIPFGEKDNRKSIVSITSWPLQRQYALRAAGLCLSTVM